jgi:hypothetical protein
MRFRRSLMAAFFAVPFAIACGSDCYDLCDDALDEACVRFDHGDCVHNCTDAEDFFEENDKCEDKYDELIDCAADLDDICDYHSGPDPKDETPDVECEEEAEEYAECFNRYCEDNPKRDWCTEWAPGPQE